MFPLELFRKLYPQFAQYDDEIVLYLSESAECYMNDCMRDKCKDNAWLLIVAHLLQLKVNAETNTSGNQIASATIDKVSVSYSVTSSGNQSQDWFNLTPFGKEFLVLLQRKCGSVKYVGGYPERSGFRIVGGRFPRG